MCLFGIPLFNCICHLNIISNSSFCRNSLCNQNEILSWLLLKDEDFELGRREKALTFPVASNIQTGSTRICWWVMPYASTLYAQLGSDCVTPYQRREEISEDWYRTLNIFRRYFCAEPWAHESVAPGRTSVLIRFWVWLLQCNTIKSALLTANAVLLLFQWAGGSWHYQLCCQWGGWSHCDLPLAFLSQTVHTTKSSHILAFCKYLLRTGIHVAGSPRFFLISCGKNPVILYSFV